MFKFRDYQKRIVRQGSKILKNHNLLYLTMEVRTGKTFTSLGICNKIKANNVLFITKKKAISSIEDDFNTLKPNYKITVINYESLHKISTDQHFDVLILDEAQDCTPLQWSVLYKMAPKVDRIYLAGDDDQAIFKWAGADIDHFIALRDEVDEIRTLNQSYRIPGGPIHELSQRIISRVKNRYEKDYKPKQEIRT